MELKDKTKFESVKNHLIKHKSKYVVGGALLLGFGLGVYFNRKKSSRNDVGIKLSGIRQNSSKIIGKFQEIDGEEFDTVNELVKAKKLIGSTSADVGDIELYYDDAGNTYAVAHGFEAYYGKKSTDTGKF